MAELRGNRSNNLAKDSMSKMTGSKGRGRNRNNSGKRPQGRGGNFDSGGRNRGNAQQLMDKYTALARDATQQGDRIAAENYYQHADHYYRVVNARNEQQEARRRSQNGNENGNTADPIPVQNSGQNPAQDRGQEQGATQGSNSGSNQGPNQGSGDSSANQPHPNKSEPDENDRASKGPAPTNTERQLATMGAQSESVQDEPPAKKPRRGRPPKKAVEEASDSPAPEAAE